MRTFRPARRVIVPLVAAAVLTAAAPPVRAHDGAGAVFDGQAGPYRVLAFDGAPGPAGGGSDEYAVLLTGALDGQPVDGAVVQVQAEPDGAGEPSRAVGPVTADAVANVYRYSLPAAEDGWRVAVSIDGPQGPADVAFSAHGSEQFARVAPVSVDRSTGSPGVAPLLVVALGGMLLAAALTLPVRWVLRRTVLRG